MVTETEVAARKLGIGIRWFGAKNESAEVEAVFEPHDDAKPSFTLVQWKYK